MPAVADLHAILDDASSALETGIADPAGVPAPQLRRLLAAAVRAYAALREAGDPSPPFPDPGAGAPAPNGTDVCLTATAMLDAVSIEVFELAMFKTWSQTAGGDAQQLD